MFQCVIFHLCVCVLVLSVCSYRMAPDVRFPVQYEECVQAARHFLQRAVLAHYSVDPERVAVCGDSAGGNLAAAVAQQVNFNPSVLDRTQTQDTECEHCSFNEVME